MHLGLLGQMGAQGMQGGSGVLQRCARWHVDHHLEFALVVKGQHLEYHPLHQRQAHRQHERRHNARQQLPAFFGAVQERGEHTGEQGIELRFDNARGGWVRVRAAVCGAHQLQSQPWRDGERNGERDGHAQARIDGDGAHVGAHQA